MSISESIANRISIRAYEPKEVSPELVDQVIEAGRWAPNHGEYHISVLRNPEIKQRLNDMTLKFMKESGVEFLLQRSALPNYQPLYGAPVAILMSAPADDMAAPLNCALAVENMLIEATALGLGSCFILGVARILRDPANRALAAEAGIPEGYDFQCGCLLGHKAPENKYSMPPEERAPRGTVAYID